MVVVAILLAVYVAITRLGVHFQKAFWGTSDQLLVKHGALIVTIGLLLVIYNWFHRNRPNTRELFFGGDRKWTLRFIVGVLGVFALGVAIIEFNLQDPRVQQFLRDRSTGLHPFVRYSLGRGDAAIFYSLVVCYGTLILVTPIIEEYFYRSYLLQSLKASIPKVAAWIVVTLVFVLNHDGNFSNYRGYSLPTILPTLYGGAVLLAVAERSRNLIAPIVLHTVINFFAVYCGSREYF